MITNNIRKVKRYIKLMCVKKKKTQIGSVVDQTIHTERYNM